MEPFLLNGLSIRGLLGWILRAYDKAFVKASQNQQRSQICLDALLLSRLTQLNISGPTDLPMCTRAQHAV